MHLGNIPTRLVVLLGTLVASLAAIALAQPSWASGAWAVFDQLVAALLGGAIVFGALLAIVLLVIEVFWPGERVLSWQGVAWLAAAQLFGVSLVMLAPHLSSVIPPNVTSSILTDVAGFVSNVGRLLGVGLIVYNSYRLAREFIRRTAGD